jgi:hypothetical protein
MKGRNALAVAFVASLGYAAPALAGNTGQASWSLNGKRGATVSVKANLVFDAHPLLVDVKTQPFKLNSAPTGDPPPRIINISSLTPSLGAMPKNYKEDHGSSANLDIFYNVGNGFEDTPEGGIFPYSLEGKLTISPQCPKGATGCAPISATSTVWVDDVMYKDPNQPEAPWISVPTKGGQAPEARVTPTTPLGYKAFVYPTGREDAPSDLFSISISSLFDNSIGSYKLASDIILGGTSGDNGIEAVLEYALAGISYQCRITGSILTGDCPGLSSALKSNIENIDAHWVPDTASGIFVSKNTIPFPTITTVFNGASLPVDAESPVSLSRRVTSSANAVEVPSPMPVLGLGSFFTWCRRLRASVRKGRDCQSMSSDYIY